MRLVFRGQKERCHGPVSLCDDQKILGIHATPIRDYYPRTVQAGEPMAVKEMALAPPSSPMESVTGTGFTVPVRLAFRVPARNAYRLVPSGAITTSKATP